MNDLIEVTKEVAACDRKDIAKSIMSICMAVTPQFYKNKDVTAMRAERLSIELLTANIDNEVLSKMCEVAVQNYGEERSKNDKVFFDINYILKFKEKADRWKNRAKWYAYYSNHLLDNEGNIIDREFTDGELCEFYDKTDVAINYL